MTNTEVTFTLRVPKALVRRLDRVALRRFGNAPRAAVIRAAIADMIAAYEPEPDATKKG